MKRHMKWKRAQGDRERGIDREEPPGCWRRIRRVLWHGRHAVAVAPVWWLVSCAVPEGSMMPADASGSVVSASPWNRPVTPADGGLDPGAMPSTPLREHAAPAESRPGLATRFGDEVREPMRRGSFVRASSKPAGTDLLYYNDRSGLKAMTSYRTKADALHQAAGGMVEWGIKSGLGYATCYRSGGRRFVEGSAGKAYSIVVRNRCRSRVEVVLSVDGLDVMDGKPAAFSKRGYLIEPGKSLEVKGWRSGWDTVARFEFSGVGASYANLRHGDTRNVGVIGLAVFGEKGVDPWEWMPDEVRTRRTATPFATAP
jgi:hypothetical protein